jgi:signal peptidase II
LKAKLWKLLLIAGLTVLIDQVSKEIILLKVPLYTNLEVIPGFFSITHIRNTGGAFGIFAGQTTGLRTLFFLIMTFLALGAVLFMYIKNKEDEKGVNIALCLIAGGALGNLIDRLRFGEVIDFLDFYVGAAHWPAFNVADSAISIGVGILFLQVFKGTSKILL